MCTTITVLALSYLLAIDLVDPNNKNYAPSGAFMVPSNNLYVMVMPAIGFLTMMAVVLLIYTVRFVAWVVKKTPLQKKRAIVAFEKRSYSLQKTQL